MQQNQTPFATHQKRGLKRKQHLRHLEKEGLRPNLSILAAAFVVGEAVAAGDVVADDDVEAVDVDVAAAVHVADAFVDDDAAVLFVVLFAAANDSAAPLPRD